MIDVQDSYFIQSDLVNNKWMNVYIPRMKECIDTGKNICFYDIYQKKYEIIPSFILEDYYKYCKDEDAKYTMIVSIVTDEIDAYTTSIITMFHHSWINALSHFIFSDGFKKILKTLDQERLKCEVFPDKNRIFNAFLKDIDLLKGVIINISPINNSSATGHCFATHSNESNEEIELFIKTYKQAIGKGSIYQVSRDLSELQDDGIMLLNYALTSTSQHRLAHIELWSRFIREVVKVFNKKPMFCYMLLGQESRKLVTMINPKHQVFVNLLLNQYLVNKEAVPIATYTSFFKLVKSL